MSTDLFEEGRYTCTICHETVKGIDLAAWVRLQKRSPFDPVCVTCLLTIFQAAEQDLQLQAALQDLFKL